MKITQFAAGLAVSALLAGCANKYDTLTPELQASMMTDLQAGKMSLDCGLKCKLTWDSQAAAIHTLDVAENWQGLATRVMQIGYGNDLAYYYLGQSAQGLQYHDAAIAYYNQANYIAASANPLVRCEDAKSGGADGCQGVDLASSIPVLIQASRDALAEERAKQLALQTPPPVHHRRHKAAATPAAAQSGQQASGWAVPPPPSSSGTAQPVAAQEAGWATPPPAKQ